MWSVDQRVFYSGSTTVVDKQPNMTIMFLGIYNASHRPVCTASRDSNAPGVALRVLETKPLGKGANAARAFRIGGLKVFTNKTDLHVFICIADAESDEVAVSKVMDEMAALPAGDLSNAQLESMLSRNQSSMDTTGEVKFRRIHQELETLKNSAIENIETLMERGGKIDVLVDKTAGLSSNSSSFRRSSNALQAQLRWNEYKSSVILSTVCGVILFIIYFAVF